MNIFWNRFFTIGGWFTWVMAGVTVVAAVGSGIAANQSKKDAEGKAGQMNKEQMKYINGMPMFEQPALPAYVPLDYGKARDEAILEDRLAYGRSDKDFAARHAPIVGAEKAFETEVAKDWKGEHELIPALQNEFMRGGMVNALGSLGTSASGSVLAPGSAGEAAVARNLGMDIMGFQDRNRKNRQQSLTLAEEIFPRRQFGPDGQDKFASAIADTENRNAWNAADYERNFAAEQARIGQATQRANATMTSQNEMAKAQAAATAARDAAVTASVNSAVGGIAKGYAGAGAGAAAQPGTTSMSGSVAVPQVVSTPNRRVYGYTPSTGWKPTGGVYA